MTQFTTAIHEATQTLDIPRIAAKYRPIVELVSEPSPCPARIHDCLEDTFGSEAWGRTERCATYLLRKHTPSLCIVHNLMRHAQSPDPQQVLEPCGLGESGREDWLEEVDVVDGHLKDIQP